MALARPIRPAHLGGLGLRMHSTNRRLLTVCAAALALAIAATACSSAVSAVPPSGPVGSSEQWVTRTLDLNQVSLSVPSSWNVGEAWLSPGSFADLVGSFSNQPLSPPCTTGPSSLSCGAPLTSLRGGGILVEVYENATIPGSAVSPSGTPTMVSGVPARVAVVSGTQGPCSDLGADLTRTVVIPHPGLPEDYIEVTVCSRGVADAVGARITASLRLKLID